MALGMVLEWSFVSHLGNLVFETSQPASTQREVITDQTVSYILNALGFNSKPLRIRYNFLIYLIFTICRLQPSFQMDVGESHVTAKMEFTVEVVEISIPRPSNTSFLAVEVLTFIPK